MSYFANFLTFGITGISNCLDLLKNSQNRSHVKGVQSRLTRSGHSGSVLEHPSGRNRDNRKEETGIIFVFILGKGLSSHLGAAPAQPRCSGQFELCDISGWEE